MSERAASTSGPPAVPISGRGADVLVALLVGVLFALSPLTSGSRRLPSLLGGAIAGVGFYLVRRRLRRPAAAHAGSTALARDPWTFLAVGLLAALALGPALYQLYPWYTNSVWRHGHGLFIPLVSFGLARVALAEDPEVGADGTAWGFAALIPGLVLIVLDAGIHTLHVSVVGLTLVATGMSLLLLGARRTRRLALPIALLLFLLPLPESLSRYLGLATSSASGAQWLMHTLGMSVMRDGNTLVLPNDTYFISYRCSGFATFYAGVAASLALGYLTGSLPRTALLLLSVWPLTVIANATRLTVLMMFCEWRGISSNATWLHGLSGIAAFFAVLAVLAVLAGPRALRKLLA